MTTTEPIRNSHAAGSPPSAATAGPDAFHNPWRGRFNAWFFTVFDGYIAHILRPQKQAAFGSLQQGTIVEIGAGVGANFDFVPAGSRVFAVEPNVAMHDGLRDRARERNVDLELHAVSAERLPFEDDSVDDVICSLVLCTVRDSDQVLAEVRRVLRPGGRLRFVEHVAAPGWSPRRWVQHVVRRPWSWVYEGCDTRRDTGGAIDRAGFSQVQVTSRRWRHSPFFPVNSGIAGIATA